MQPNGGRGRSRGRVWHPLANNLIPKAILTNNNFKLHQSKLRNKNKRFACFSIYVYFYVCVNTRMRVCVYSCMSVYARLYACVFVCVYAIMCVRAYTFFCMRVSPPNIFCMFLSLYLRYASKFLCYYVSTSLCFCLYDCARVRALSCICL